jgi:hypothetical protein
MAIAAEEGGSSEVESVVALLILGLNAFFFEDFPDYKQTLEISAQTPTDRFLSLTCGYFAVLVTAIEKLAASKGARGQERLVAGLDHERRGVCFNPCSAEVFWAPSSAER